MTVTSDLLDLIQSAKVYDLAQPYFIGMPHHPVHPPYLFGLVKKHGELLRPRRQLGVGSSGARRSRRHAHRRACAISRAQANCTMAAKSRSPTPAVSSACRSIPWRRSSDAACSWTSRDTQQRGCSADRFPDHARAPGRRRARPARRSPLRRCRAAPHRLGALLGRRRPASSRRSTRSRSGRTRRALDQRESALCRRLRHRGFRVRPRAHDAGARPPAGRERYPHHRVPEPRATGR